MSQALKYLLLYDFGGRGVEIELPGAGGGNNGGGGSSGGGGSNGGGVANVGSIGANTPTDTQVSLNKNNYSFVDINNHWGASYIQKLYSSGIVSGDPDGKFRPDDSITREEFVKLVIAATGLDLVNASQCSFGDVDSTKWYMPYISAAVEKGIVSGYPDGTFGIGQTITRQDASVLCFRALNKPITVSADSFTDDSSIASYAKEAVYAQRAIDIITGFEDNTFRPLETLTRAQAAKIIFMLMENAG